MRPVRALAVALLATAALSGCAVTTMETTFDDALIRDVGAGSDAVGRIETTLTDAFKVNDGVDDEKLDKPMMALLRGQLHKLSYEDIDGMASTNRRSRKRFKAVLGKLRAVGAGIDDAQVDAAAHPDLSGGAQEFLRRWNSYLDVNATRVITMTDALDEMRPMFGRFDALLTAAVDTAELGHTRVFDPLRRDMLDTLDSDVQRFHAKLGRVTELDDADRELVELVKDDTEAQAIVTAVNKKHPDGMLAKMVSE
jgi:hypothetical protein